MKASYKKFEELLVSKNLTPYRIYKMTGVATSTLSDWKNGKSTPKADKLSKIAGALEVPISYFYEEDSEQLKYVNLFSGIGSLKKDLTPTSMCIQFADEPEIHMHSRFAYDLVKRMAGMTEDDLEFLAHTAEKICPTPKIKRKPIAVKNPGENLKITNVHIDDVVPFPQYPSVTNKDIDEFAARNAKKKFTREEIAEMLYEMKQEDE